LRRVAEVERVLAADPLTWSAGEALSLLTFPRQHGQERFFTNWWDASPERRAQVAGRLLAFVAVATARDSLGRLGVGEADVALWGRWAGPADPALDAPFPGIDVVCPPKRATAPRSTTAQRAIAGAPPYRVGERVRHPTFGQGVVVAVEAGSVGRAVEWFLSVEFPGRGLVKLLANIAPLTREG
jgi:hypothetical protein